MSSPSSAASGQGAAERADVCVPALLVLEPMFEADLAPERYAYRPLAAPPR